MRPTWLLAATGFLAAIGIVALVSCASPRDQGRSPESTVAMARRGPHGKGAHGSRARNDSASAQPADHGGGCSDCGSGGMGKAPDSLYPLKSCVVSGKDLGSMGDPVEIDHQGTRVLLCCRGCIESFQAEPEKYMTALRSASGGEATTPGR